MDSYCRFCGLQNKEKRGIHLFDNKLFAENFYAPAEIVKLVFKDIELNKHDELPKEICSQCANNLLLSFRFYNIINNTKIKLLEILKQKNNTFQKKYNLLLPKSTDLLNKLEPNCVDKIIEKRMYFCYECPEKYRALRQLKKHQDDVHFTTNLCNFCNVWFERDENLQQHILKRHHISKYICFKCSTKDFSSQRRLFTHSKRKHFAEHGIFKCETCQKEILGRRSLNEHILEHHPKKTENIENSDETNIEKLNIQEVEIKKEAFISEELNLGSMVTMVEKTESNIDSNKLDEVMDVEFLDEFFLNQHADNSFEFNECWDALDLSFEDDIKIKMSDLANEILPQFQTHDISGKICQYQCPHCKRGFVRQIGVLLHLAHDHKMPVLSCSICLENFSNLDEYKMHKIQHLGKNMVNRIEQEQIEIIKTMDGSFYICKYCRRKYKEKNNIMLHNCKKHDTESTKFSRFICNFCKEEFLNLKDMYLHKRLKHHKENLTCFLCEKGFRTALGLQYHIKAHKGLKKIKCPFCVRKFLTKINLNAHIKAIHSIVKNHLCTLCDRNFATLDHLKKHVMSVHQKERPHLCSVCGKLFSQVSHLKSHFKIHNLF